MGGTLITSVIVW